MPRDVSVVVVTRNRVDELLVTIDRLRALPDPPPITVVDNGSTDGTPERVRRAQPEVEVVEAGENLGAAGRNLGVARARTPYVAFCDDDTWWLPGSLERAREVLAADPQIGLVTGRMIVGPDERDDPLAEIMAASPLSARAGLPGTPVLGFLAGASMVRRDAFLAVGGFEPLLVIYGEEELFALDLVSGGWDLVYLADVVVRHLPSPARNSAERIAMQARNQLWVSWLRHPAGLAGRRTARLLRRSVREPAVRLGVAEAVRGLPGVVRRRRRLTPAVARAARLLETQR